MATNKNLLASHRSLILLAVLLAALTGCGPPGPRAFLKGRKLLERGDYSAAVEQLSFAAKTLGTNAQVWNYLGLACHRAGQWDAGAEAYQKALKLNPDLIIAHYNLGCLLLDANRPDKLETARTELTSFTMLQGNSAPGWLKRGSAELRLKDLNGADKSFRQALALAPTSAEAWNGLGLIQWQRTRPKDAITCFTNALANQPRFGPALLNLAVAYQNTAGGRQLALQKYNEYLALNPKPADWEAVSAVARSLEQEIAPTSIAAAKSQTNLPSATTNIAVASTARTATNSTRANPPATEFQRAESPPNTRSTVASNSRTRPAVEPTVPTEVVVLPGASASRSNGNSSRATRPSESGTASDPVVVNPPDDAAPSSRPGFLQRINPFRREPAGVQNPSPQPETVATTTVVAVATPPTSRPAAIPRYSYISPPKPPDGDRAEGERLFARASQAQSEKRYRDAESLYRAATQADSGFFEAQSYLGLTAFQLGEMTQSLIAYETALAIRPDSFNTRFNFALALAKANYSIDAAQELEKLLVNPPSDQPPGRLANVHLTLANLYAEQFHRPGSARPHYQKVLELDPQNSQATAIRYWLRDNP